jgi:NADH dehydrogenase
MSIDARLPVGAVRCPRRTARFETLLEPADWDRLLDGIDVVVNCVGILRQRGAETYDRVHHRAPAALARACAARAIRLVHVSALALHDGARSRFLRSKLAGERAIRASGADWRIVRPSLLDGPDGYGARWLRLLARLPVHAFPADARGRIAALSVDDLGEALANLALARDLPDAAAAHACVVAGTGKPGNDVDAVSPAHADREYEFGGETALPLGAYLAALRGRPAWTLPIPGPLARALAHACDVLHFSPYSFGHWELLRRDNMPGVNRLREVLGRAPRPILPVARPAPAPALPETPVHHPSAIGAFDVVRHL